MGRCGGFAGAALSLCVLAPAAAAQTHAGTAIANQATLTFNTSGTPGIVASNTVTLTTAEILDVTVVADHDTLSATSGTVAIGFIVTNTGNGNEDFALSFASDRSSVAVTRIAIDTDNNGIYDAAVDQSLTTGVISLAPGQARRVFVLVDGAQVADTTRISATATAKTGSGTPGTIFTGAGDGGGDAVVGHTGATASAATTLSPAVAGQPGLAKAQSVLAPDGSSRPVTGAVVTYSLTASFPAATHGAVLDDPIPAGTTYVAGSMSLDGRALSDAADSDAGMADASGIHVTLGDVTAATTRTIQFSVTIQ